MTPTPHPTSWDTDPHLWPRTSPLHLFRRTLPHARCLARITPFESAAADLYNPAAPPPPVRALAADVLTRRAAIERYGFTLPIPTLTTRTALTLTSAAALLTAYTTLWTGPRPLIIAAALLGALILLALPLHARTRARRARLTRSLRDRACPDCNYNLAGAPEGLPGSLAGPRTCPECGAPWPLVPPPA